MKLLFKRNILAIIFFSFYFFVGILTFKDYGVGIEEHFQRSSGFYWLNYILQFTDFDNLKTIIENKILEIKDFNPNLPPVEIAKHYGIIFDLPAAFIESIFNIDEPQDYFHLRHFLNYTFFFISGIFFYNILQKRFSSNFIALLGSFFYLLSPRIYGNSFFDGKDLFFLSILTVTIFFYFKFENRKTIFNLIIFALFSALATSSRIVGIIIPITFLIIIFFEILGKGNKAEHFKFIFLYIFSYFIFLFLHWPYLWTLNFYDFLNFFETFRVKAFPIVLFNGEFWDANHLPIRYLPIWILISTPVLFLILFFIGISNYLKRVFIRILNIKETSIKNDFWSGLREKKDFFIFLNFLQIIMMYLSIKLTLFGGWRHFLFLNFFLAYFASFANYLIYLKIRKRKIIRLICLFLFFTFISEVVYKLYIYHPYQSLYFNNLLSDNKKKLYEVDTQSLSRSDGIKEIIKDNKENRVITIATASWTPLHNGRSLIKKKYWDNLIFSGTNNKSKADYIYTNYYYEVDVRYNKKYQIPENFYLYKRLTLDNTVVYSIYKKNKN